MDTWEVIDLYLCAPALYSKPSVADVFWLRLRRAVTSVAKQFQNLIDPGRPAY
jgi:hypothetical protein